MTGVRDVAGLSLVAAREVAFLATSGARGTVTMEVSLAVAALATRVALAAHGAASALGGAHGRLRVDALRVANAASRAHGRDNGVEYA